MHSQPARFTSSKSNSSVRPSNWSVFQNIGLIILLVIPVVIYYVVIYKNAYNFPYEDDFNSALSFISDYAFSGLSLWGKLKLIFSQYNEHRIVFDRLVFLGDFWAYGELNFRHLILIGNLALPLICILIVKVAFRTVPLTQKLLSLVPVAYSLFLFQYWELSTWSMAALQNLYVVPFAMFSVYKLSQPGRTAFAVACAAALLATFTSGNGMFTFVVGILLLLFLKSYRKLALWMVISALSIGFYFWHYIRPPYHPDVVDSLVNHTGRAISYFFTLTGSLTGVGRPKVAILFGVGSLLLTVGLLAYLWHKKRITTHLSLVSWLLFFYLTCLSLMASRSGMGVGQAFSTRYGIVVVMLFITQSILVIETFTKPVWRLGVTLAYGALAILFFVSGNNAQNRRNIEERTTRLKQLAAQYHSGSAYLALPYGDVTVARTIFDDAIRKGIYRVPNEPNELLTKSQ